MVFIVEDFPKKRTGGVGRGPSLVDEMEEAQADPGTIYCVKSYEKGASASGMAQALRKRYPKATILSRLREDDSGLYGVFVRF